MNFLVRRAAADDVPSIARIMQATSLENNPDTDRIARVLADHVSLVAEYEGVVAGFVDAFATKSAEGVPRWEIDLLGVDPRWQGRGIARQLVLASVHDASARGITYTRALIRMSNGASQHAFAACSFVPQFTLLELYVADPLDTAAPDVPPDAHLINVETFTYSGLWIEGAFSPSAFTAARVLLHQTACSQAGALIAQDDAAAITAAERAGYVSVGEFAWWERATSGAV